MFSPMEGAVQPRVEWAFVIGQIRQFVLSLGFQSLCKLIHKVLCLLLCGIVGLGFEVFGTVRKNVNATLLKIQCQKF